MGMGIGTCKYGHLHLGEQIHPLMLLCTPSVMFLGYLGVLGVTQLRLTRPQLVPRWQTSYTEPMILFFWATGDII